MSDKKIPLPPNVKFTGGGFQRCDAEIESLRAENERLRLLSKEDCERGQALLAEVSELREALEYALGCIDGTIRDYADELPKKLRAALAKTGEEK